MPISQRPTLGTSKRTLIRLVWLVPIGALTAWAAVKTAVVGEIGRVNPMAAAVLAPRHPDLEMRMAMAEFRVNGGKVSAERRAAAIDALRSQPLADEPFLLAAVDAIAKGNRARGYQLLLETKRRNPRSRLTRLLLLDQLTRSGKTVDAMHEITALSRLVPRTSEVLVPELARMAAQPDQRASVRGVLVASPGLLAEVLAHMAGTGADPDLIVELAGPQVASRSEAARQWQSALLADRVKRGDYARAYRLWRLFGGGANGEKADGVYDGRFEGKPGLAPFAWSLFSNAGGVAERRGSSLDVIYYGREGVELASQLLLLSPGQYRVQFQAEGSGGDKASKVLWQIRCAGSDVALLALPVTTSDAPPQIVNGTFIVPAKGCPAQSLTLVGQPAEFPVERNLTIRDLRIERNGS